MSYPYKVYPRDEQLRALKKIYKRKGVAVFGDMGTGKTKIGGDFIANMVWHKHATKAVVIAPMAALGVWEQYFEDNCDFIKFSYYIKGKEPDWTSNVILINYDYFRPRAKKRILTKGRRKGQKKRYISWDICNRIIEWAPQIAIIDEGHKIKKPSSRQAKACHKIATHCEYRLDLTGTPTGNKKIIDLWSQFQFVAPDLLGSFDSFKNTYGVWGGFLGKQLIRYRNLGKLSKILRPYIVRIKKNLGVEKQFIPYRIKLPSSVKSAYDELEKEFITEIAGKVITASMALSKTTKLTQLAGGFIREVKGGPEIPVHREKLNALDEIMDGLRENGTTRAVIFARYLWEIAEIRKLLEAKGWWVHRVSGKVERATLDRFNTTGGVMLCQIQSGSIANNFQAANYCIFYSTNYSLIDFQQAVDRIHRLGQDKTCFYYLLIAQGTLDAKIFRTLQNDKEVADEILNILNEIKQERNMS